MTDPPRLARLPVARVRAAPLAVLAQRDAIRVVALALVRLVVAPLALLAGEGDCDADVSAGHTPLRVRCGPTGWSGQKNDPRRASRHRILARHRPPAPPPDGGPRTVVGGWAGWRVVGGGGEPSFRGGGPRGGPLGGVMCRGPSVGGVCKDALRRRGQR